MSKHTPGPWRWVGGTEYSDDYSEWHRPTIDIATYQSPGYYNNPTLVGAGDEQVVGCDEYNILMGSTADERAANGRLIAAAPDLLEALQYVMSAHGEQLTDAFDMARKAIAKATGGEP